MTQHAAHKSETPFEEDRLLLSSGAIEPLRNWLAENANPGLIIAGEYTVAMLIDDLDEILRGMWSDSIDAMGEDA